MAAKQPIRAPAPADDEGRFRQPTVRHGVMSEEGQKWREESAEAARAWADWVEKNGVPLRPLF